MVSSYELADANDENATIHVTQNGWTKEAMLKHIKENFKGKSVRPERPSACLYRAPEGRKCAVGLFIKDEDYSETMENKGSDAVITESDSVADSMPLDKRGMGNLQTIHDESNEANTLTEMLKFVEKYVEDA